MLILMIPSDIPVDDAVLVEVVYRRTDLFEHWSSLVLLYRPAEFDVLQQVAMPGVLHNDVDLGYR